MSFNTIEASKKISSKYRRYLTTMFDISDREYKAIFNEKLAEFNTFEKGPFLDVSNSFSKGRSIQQLINDGIISSDFKYIDRLYNIKNLHLHQEEALLKAIDGKNLVVSTGTGSGKTECFLLPIINELMREKENNALCPGVRALIIYPMNALANDQIDRLRKMFVDYPDITFGCYTGQTKHHEKTKGNNKGAIDQYKELNGQRIDDTRLRMPLKNERISRDSMKDNPPHILITNYAILEYLMLRPEDNVFFDGDFSKYWKYIVLDEAHTYTGSTGIEVSLLLRRLLAQLEKKDIQFILTSATLGSEDTNREVVSFAEKLCSVEFKEENIIRAKRVELKDNNIKYTFDIDFYNYVESLIDYGYDDNYIIERIESELKFGVTANDLNEYLYDILISDNTFWKIKKFLSNPRSITEIMQYTGYSEREISSFVEVASKACKNNSKLFDSRYHMFLRATESIYITLAPNKDLFLTRKNEVEKNKETYKVFEIVTCKQCHSIYILGYINEDGYLIQKTSVDADEIQEAFYLGNQINDSDEDNSLESSDLSVETYELCPHCGFIRSKSENTKRLCGHDESHFVDVVKVKTRQVDGRVTKCICCENVNRLGILRGFFSGQEASTSVIGTALFEELPSHIKKVTLNTTDESDGFDIETGESVEEVAKAKQFIAFSDSRQAAAYYSSYFSVSYNTILYGRLIKKELDSSNQEQIDMNVFINNLSAQMKAYNIIPFDEYLYAIKTNNISIIDYEKIAWQAVLKQLVDCGQRNSLIGLGLLGLNFNSNIKFGPHKKYKLDSEEVRDICMVFVMAMLSDAAMYCPKTMNDLDKEFYTHNGVELSYLKESGSKYVRSFVPLKESLSNKRLDYMMKVLKTIDQNITRDDAIKVLKQIWDSFFAHNQPNKPQIMYRNNKANYIVNLENIVFEKNKKWYKCDKCKKITSFNVKNVCPSYRCEGKLELVNIDELEKNNHYYRMYHDLTIQPLRIVEHTAQLDREEAYNYQNLFKDQKIDVLSCSTTFEMGVDVGDLETVFMRNMPPSPSNYAQRAGRAGRSSTSAAFALTFCNKSNHDFNYFEKPKEMIFGSILPPQFKIDNEKICIRHLYSSMFSFFFKYHPDYFTNAKSMMEKNDKTGFSGFDALKSFLTKNDVARDEIKKYLKASIPHSLHKKFELDSFEWINWLYFNGESDYPSLENVRTIYKKEMETLRTEYENAKNANNHQLFTINKRIRTYEEEPIISYLSRNNILPKYGFPVDTVELELNMKTSSSDLSGLELSRDLSMAISEYAPGCQVVANNKLVTSRYIKKNPGLDWRKYDYIKCDNCKTLNVSINTQFTNGESQQSCNCKQCGNAIETKKIKTFLIPEFGFIAEEKIGKPSLIKPEKTYRSEASFFDYNDNIQEEKYEINGTEISISIVGNDGEMVMLNTTDFFVCSNCGYAIESPAGTNQYVKVIKNNTHKDSRGYTCNKHGDLQRYSLGYKFKTDVIRIKIKYPLITKNEKYEEAYSILQAIVLASCKELNIENSEIAGCLQYYNELGCGDNYSYILYDKTPGGAGHVKRLNNKEVITHVLINAMNMTQKCVNCDKDSSCYSCLRTYQNQRHHDIIKRKYVYNYLRQVLSEYSDDDSNVKIEDMFLSKLQESADLWMNTNNNEYIAQFGKQKWTIKQQVNLNLNNDLILPSHIDFLLVPDDTNQKEIVVFIESFNSHNDIIDKDSFMKDAIILLGNYRVWTLSINDIEKRKIQRDNVDAIDSLELLITYLKDKFGEKRFAGLANTYFNDMISKSEHQCNINNELALIKEQFEVFNLTKETNIHKYMESKDSNLIVYLANDGIKKVITYIQDNITKRELNFSHDWQLYLILNNIMQFLDLFIMTTQQGLDNDCYSVLSNTYKINFNSDEKWKEILSLVVCMQAKNFINDCIRRGVQTPDGVGYELDDGSIAELVWDSLKIAYLTREQIEYEENFKNKGYNVVTSIFDLEKLLKK